MAKNNSDTIRGSVSIPWFEYLFGAFRGKTITRSTERNIEVSGSPSRTNRRDYKQAVESAVESSRNLCKILKENY